MNENEWITPWIIEFGDKITQFLYTYTRDQGLAEDLSQEVFVRLYRFHSLHPHRAIHGGWLYTTARHLVIDAHRKARRHPEQWENGENESRWFRDEGFEQAVTTRLAVQQAVDHLPLRDRECLWLFYYQGWSVPEMATQLHLSEANVRTRLHRARKHFAHLWKGANDDGF